MVFHVVSIHTIELMAAAIVCVVHIKLLKLVLFQQFVYLFNFVGGKCDCLKQICSDLLQLLVVVCHIAFGHTSQLVAC